MTLRPVEDVRIEIPPQDCWTPYDLPPTCQVPRCMQRWDHRHHIVRRSATAGPKRWISVDGLILPNVAGLCKLHHDQVTGGIGGHQAKIGFPSLEQLVDGLYRAWWLWYARLPAHRSGTDDWVEAGPLDQPVYL